MRARAASGDSQQEIGAVEHIECLPLELQMNTFGDRESLGQRHIGIPLAGTDKIVSTLSAHASQTRLGQSWKIRSTWSVRARRSERVAASVSRGVARTPTIGPSSARESRVLDRRVWTIIASPI